MKSPLPPRLRRLNSYESCKNEDQRFSKVLSAIKERDLEQLCQVIDHENLPVCYQEPGKGNRTALHYATKSNFQKGVRHLLKSGAKCNIADNNGLYPLHLAAAQGAYETCAELIRAGADVNALDKKGRTPLHWAVCSFCSLDEESKENYVKVTRLLLEHKARPTIQNGEGRLPLHLAAQAGFEEGMHLLVSFSGSGTVSYKDINKQTPLHYAVYGARSLPAIVFLLEKGACVDSIDDVGHTALHVLAKRNVTFVDEEFDLCCLEILLNYGACVHLADKDGMNPLALTLVRTMWWGRGSSRDFLLTFVQMLVAKGSKITCSFTMWRMIETFPSLLHSTLNHSISTNTSVGNSVHLVLEFDMRSLIASGTYEYCLKKGVGSTPDGETAKLIFKNPTDVSILHYLILTGNKHILSHPLCRTFLSLKWSKIRKYFVINFVFKTLFTIFFTWYTFLITSCDFRHHQYSSLNTTNIEETFEDDSTQHVELFNQTCTEAVPHIPKDMQWIHIVLGGLYFILLIREMLQFSLDPLKHLLNWKRLLSVLVLALIPITALAQCPCDDIWWVQTAAITMIVTWISLLLSLSEFPSFGVYIVMFSTVARNVFKLLGFYLLLLIAFAAGFYVLLRPYDTFNTFWISAATTFVMMTGEFDYATVFVENGKEEVKHVRIMILLAFIFLVYIILSNLLVGLAVSDMAAIRKRSELMRLTSQVYLMLQFENIVNAKFIPGFIRKFLKSSISLCRVNCSPIISILPNERRGKISRSYKMLSNIIPRQILNKVFECFVDGFIAPKYEPELPPALLKASMDIALTQFEIEKRDKLMRHRRTFSLGKFPMKCIKPRWQPPGLKLESEKFVDIHDESSTTPEEGEGENDLLLSKSVRFLTLKKSSRKNMFDTQQSVWSNFSNVNVDPQADVVTTLRTMQSTINNLLDNMQPSFSRGNSQLSRSSSNPYTSEV